MKNLLLLSIVLIIFYFFNSTGKKEIIRNNQVYKKEIIKNNQVNKKQLIVEEKTEKKEIIKIDSKYGIKEEIVEYRTTNYDSRLLPNPDSNSELRRVPPNTKLKVIEKRRVQQGRMSNNWYKVSYKGNIGWISGWNMKEQEELIVTSVEEMNINYIDKIGPFPKNDPVTGKISEVVDWLKENSHDYNSIKYVQWYKPFVLNNSWICRVQYKGKNLFGDIVFEDKLFKIDNNKVIDVTNYSD